MKLLAPPDPATRVGASPGWAPPGIVGASGASTHSGGRSHRTRQRRRDRLARLARLTLLAGAAVIAVRIEPGIVAALLALFVLVVPFEKLYPRQRGQKLRRPMLGTDLGFALLGPALNIVGLAAIVLIGGLSLFWLPGLAISPLVDLIPSMALPVVGFVLFDLVSYWTHRFAHEVPFMWRFHSVHHSPEHMDWVSGFRLHPFDGVVIAPAFFFLLGAGFGAELAGVFAVFQVILGLFFHANVRVRWRLLDRVVANPEFHHWHHSSEDDAVGHNYGAALPWWDLAFGTFFMPAHRTGRRPARYGVDEPLPHDLLGQLTHPCRGWRTHLWLWRHPVLLVRTIAIATRNLLADIRRSALRPTHSIRREMTAGCATTNASLLGPDARSKPPKRPLPSKPAARRPAA